MCACVCVLREVQGKVLIISSGCLFKKVVNVVFKSSFVSFLKIGDRVCFGYKSDFNLSNVYGDCFLPAFSGFIQRCGPERSSVGKSVGP